MWFSIDGRPTKERSMQVIERAVELGVTFIDTADVYCLDNNDLHHNELLIAEALDETQARDRVLVATKGGLTRPGGRWERDGRPERLREAALRSRDALRVERIALYQLHAPGRDVPLESSLEALADLQAEEVIESIGLSNVTLDEVRTAEAIISITSVQNRYNPWDRNAEESGLLEHCEEAGITFIPYSPLGGARRVVLMQAHGEIRSLADENDATPAELVLAWHLMKSGRSLPIPSARRTESIESSVRAASLQITRKVAERLEATYASLPP
jgi:aryl-alcohol dehydrogenase-like predicted oxidoreductase